MAICPGLAVLILTWRADGKKGRARVVGALVDLAVYPEPLVGRGAGAYDTCYPDAYLRAHVACWRAPARSTAA